MNGKGKMKVSLVILIAAVNLFMHVNSTEKRQITCGKRATFFMYFWVSDSLIPSRRYFWHKHFPSNIFPSLFCLVPSRSQSPLALYARSLHPSLTLLACLSRLVSRAREFPNSTQPCESPWMRQFLIDFLYLSFILGRLCTDYLLQYQQLTQCLRCGEIRLSHGFFFFSFLVKF